MNEIKFQIEESWLRLKRSSCKDLTWLIYLSCYIKEKFVQKITRTRRPTLFTSMKNEKKKRKKRHLMKPLEKIFDEVIFYSDYSV